MGAQQARPDAIPAEKRSEWSFSYEGHSPVFQDSWSKLPRDVVIDKIRGIAFGQAIGDALGLSTEFMNKAEAQTYYGAEGPKDYNQCVQDFHRSRWKCGDWTDDTDQMILILASFNNYLGKAVPTDLAKRLLSWKNHGFPDLGDIGGMGIGLTTVRVLTSANFLKDPHQAADDVWQASGRYLAANGAVMRTSICGAANFNDMEKVLWQSRELCLVTHADPRCVASCAMVSSAIALMLQGEYDTDDAKQVAQLIDQSSQLAERFLVTEQQSLAEFKRHANVKSWSQLKLADQKTMGYTFKAMGAGVHGLRTSTDFQKTITELVMEAGDADSNASVCGGLLGCKYGYSGLPRDLLNGLLYHDWLFELVDKFLTMMGLLNVKNGAEQEGAMEADKPEEVEVAAAPGPGDSPADEKVVASPGAADEERAGEDTVPVPAEPTPNLAPAGGDAVTESQPPDEAAECAADPAPQTLSELTATDCATVSPPEGDGE